MAEEPSPIWLYKAGVLGGTDTMFLLRTARVSSVPTEISHTASAAMLGQFNRRVLKVHGTPCTAV